VHSLFHDCVIDDCVQLVTVDEIGKGAIGYKEMSANLFEGMGEVFWTGHGGWVTHFLIRIR
jgi:hypothetical protein